MLKGFAFGSEFFNEKDEGVPLIRIRDLAKDQTECYYSGPYDSTYLVGKGDILVGMDGEFNAYLWSGPDGLLNQRVCKIWSKDYTKLNNSFLFYELHRPLKRIEAQTSQTTVKHLLDKDMKRISIPLPPLKEQQGVVEVISCVDLAIQKTDEVIGKTERLKKGLMQELLTKGIGPKKFQDTEIGTIPKGWEVVRIGDKITLQRGYDLPDKQRQEGPFPVIGSNGIVGYHDRFMAEGPGVIVGRSGTLGRVYYCEEKFWPLNTSLFVKRFKNCHRKFVFYFLQEINLKRFSAGTSVPTLNRNLVHPAKVPFPKGIGEQERIADILTTIDQKLEFERKEKTQLERIKLGLMDLLLTGKIRAEVS